MCESAIPEMLQVSLESIILKIKLLDMSDPLSMLSGFAMDAPTLESVENTILLLKEAGALLKTVNGVYSKIDGDLTFIGRIMAALPIDVQRSRLIILGYCFGVIEDCIIMGKK